MTAEDIPVELLTLGRVHKSKKFGTVTSHRLHTVNKHQYILYEHTQFQSTVKSDTYASRQTAHRLVQSSRQWGKQAHTSYVWVSFCVLPLQSPVLLRWHDTLSWIARQALIPSISCNAFKTNPVCSASHWPQPPYRFSFLAFLFSLHCQLYVNIKASLPPSLLSYCTYLPAFLYASPPLFPLCFWEKILSHVKEFQFMFTVFKRKSYLAFYLINKLSAYSMPAL